MSYRYNNLLYDSFRYPYNVGMLYDSYYGGLNPLTILPTYDRLRFGYNDGCVFEYANRGRRGYADRHRYGGRRKYRY